MALVDAGRTPAFPTSASTCAAPLALKLKGTIGITPEARNIVTFDGLPDIPIADFTLTFAGGPKAGSTPPAAISARPPPLVFDANFTSFSGAAVSTSRDRQRSTAAARPAAAAATAAGNRKPPKAKISLQAAGSHQPRHVS